MKKIFGVLLLCSAALFGQSRVNGNRNFYGDVNMSQATKTAPIKVVTSDPSTCDSILHEQIFNSTTKQIKVCTDPNTWTVLGGGGSSNYQTLAIGGTPITQRPTLNLIPGANITITPADDGSSSNITIAASASSGLTNPMTTAGDIIFGGTSGAPSRLGTGTGVLHGGTTPSWGLVNLATEVTGSLPYSSVSGTPTIPTNNTQLTNGANFVNAAGAAAAAPVQSVNGSAGNVTLDLGTSNTLNVWGNQSGAAVPAIFSTTSTMLNGGTGLMVQNRVSPQSTAGNFNNGRGVIIGDLGVNSLVTAGTEKIEMGMLRDGWSLVLSRNLQYNSACAGGPCWSPFINDSSYPYAGDLLELGAEGISMHVDPPGASTNSRGISSMIMSWRPADVRGPDASGNDTSIGQTGQRIQAHAPIYISYTGNNREYFHDGATSPAIHIIEDGTGLNDPIMLDNNDSTFRAGSMIQFRKSGGNPSIGGQTIVQANDNPMALYSYGYDGAAYQLGAGIITFVSGTPSAGSVCEDMRFRTGANVGSIADRLSILCNGNVGIGNTNPSSLLSVGTSGQFQVNTSGILSLPRLLAGSPTDDGNSAAQFQGGVRVTRAGQGAINTDGLRIERYQGSGMYVQLNAFGGAGHVFGVGNGVQGFLRLGTSDGTTEHDAIYIDNTDNVGIGTAATTPPSLLSVGNTYGFQVDGNGNIVKLNGATTTFPTVNSAGCFFNDGSGNISYTTCGGGGGMTNPMTAAGDFIYGGTSGAPTRLARGAGVLHSGTTPSWGLVNLASDVTGLLPYGSISGTPTIPTLVSQLTNDSSFVNAAGAAAAAPVQSVAGHTGAVTLAAADIPALPASKITSGTFSASLIPAINLATTGAGGVTGLLPYASVSGTPTLYNQTVQHDGTAVTQRAKFNLAAGSGVTISAADNGTDTTTFTLTATGGGTGNVNLTSGTADPTANCTAGTDWYLNTTTQETWFCSATNAWKKNVSTDNSGAFVATLLEGTTPATPSAGNGSLFASSTDHNAEYINSSGVVLGMVKPIAAAAHKVLTAVAANGTFTQAQLAYSDIASTPTLYNQTIQVGGSGVAQEPTVNFVAGSGVTITPTDGASTTTLTITATGGGTGNMVTSSGTTDPSANCTVGINWYVNTTTHETWTCADTNTWRKLFSTLNTGAFVASGTTSVSLPAAPSSGSASLFFNSSSVAQTENSAGAIASTQVVPGSSAGQVVAGVNTDGSLSFTTVSGGGPIPRVINASFDGGGSALTAGKTMYSVIPFACTLAGWSITADTGTATVKMWKVAGGTAIPTVANSINTSGVSLATGTNITSTTMTDFTTTAVSANDIVGVNLTAVSGATFVKVGYKCNE